MSQSASVCFPFYFESLLVSLCASMLHVLVFVFLPFVIDCCQLRLLVSAALDCCHLCSLLDKQLLSGFVLVGSLFARTWCLCCWNQILEFYVFFPFWGFSSLDCLSVSLFLLRGHALFISVYLTEVQEDYCGFQVGNKPSFFG